MELLVSNPIKINWNISNIISKLRYSYKEWQNVFVMCEVSVQKLMHMHYIEY